MNFRLIDHKGQLDRNWQWRLELEDQAVCFSPGYATEKECRSALARAKRAMGGAKFAKVLKASYHLQKETPG